MGNLQMLLNHQNRLQKKLKEKLAYNTTPDEIKTLGELKNYVVKNKLAIDAEFIELLTAIGRQDNAIWKSWKTNYKTLQNIKIDELTEEEKEEIYEEFIDILHFVFNIALALGLDEEKIMDIYIKKNKKNEKRYESNY